MALQNPRLHTALRRFLKFAAASGSLAFVLTALSTTSTQTAIANGDTRTINLVHAHTGETISATFRVNGSYDPTVLKQLNWFLRDWRRDEQITMDPRLFDVIWEAQRGAGSRSVIRVQSAYRSPETNSMLRRRSRAVAEYSQHTQGRAMDIHVDDVPMSYIRETAMRMQRGGVGYYPTANSPFVHLDVGSVRAWPRMTYDQLARLFPDGKTVHIPANGQPMARYEEARAEIEARGGGSMPSLAQVQSKGFFATLFGWGEEEEDMAPAPRQVASRRGAPAPVRTAAATPPTTAYAAAEDNTAASFFRNDASRRDPSRVAAAQLAATAQPVPQQVQPAQLAPVAAAPEAQPAAVAAMPAPRGRSMNSPVDLQTEIQVADVPMPPRRPSDTQVEAMIAAAVPLPPQRPAGLIVLAKNEPPKTEAPLPTAKPARDALAALIGGTVSGKVAATPGLPAVITQGTPVSANVLAFAPLQADVPKPTARPQPRSTPVVARLVGVRAARDAHPAPLSAARLDRSNFSALLSPASISKSPVAGLVASTVAPLRASSRNELKAVMFGPPIPVQVETSDNMASAVGRRAEADTSRAN
ncbi:MULTISPECIES: DUF882 domain-containing protein [unclassified Beijerinckia]|uniref:DUF882 domain-containing protein n=1 Tax=unclassified Beijerinckia TaxID=2638183 RepID=UPI001FCD6437|nr:MULTISPECIES: DUF882 domain-containing protein [unclassified Beijerinckia]MDH7798794.1 uncharacterized protein YcbK (DUF882 family) [Beijerinckia sp. GAS462]